MARKTPSRMELRKMAEAAEAQSKEEGSATKAKKKKRKTTKRASRSKEKAPERRRLVWGVYSGSMKEEARFPYAERDAAVEKAAQLQSKGKKQYFVQPIKEVITEPLPTTDGDEAAGAKTAKAKKTKKVAKKTAAKKKTKKAAKKS
jgi:hypothetical protein